MDCEKFEPLLLDELYEELDELTSAAVKRHVSGCARCGSILSGLRSTRRAVTLPLVAVPAGLEDRILAAAKEAQKVTPIRSRLSRVISVAGSWAMRPQTAMAAVFLLMIGSSAFLIRSNHHASKDGAVAVTVEGAPAPTAIVAPSESLGAEEDKAAAAAHGPSNGNLVHPPVAAPAPSAFALNDDAPADPLGRDRKDDEDLAGRTRAAPGAVANAAPPAGAPYGGLAGGAADPYTQQPSKPMARSGPAQAQDAFSLGAAAFRARNFAEATRRFDEAAATGDTNAALWAAESTREGQGCAVALGRFDQLAQKSSGWVGHEASLRAARCQIAMGQGDAARDRLNVVAQGGSTEQKQSAQQSLTELSQIAGRKAGGSGATGGAVAAPKRAAAPAAPRSPVRAPSETQENRKVRAIDSASAW